MSNVTTFDRWPRQLRESRGLLNGKRVQMAYEVRGMPRYQLAHRLGISAKELKQREQGWAFWEEDEKACLLRVTDFPLAFFTQEDPYEFPWPTFICCTDEDGHTYCHVEGKR